jgi:hypothetical protein
MQPPAKEGRGNQRPRPRRRRRRRQPRTYPDLGLGQEPRASGSRRRGGQHCCRRGEGSRGRGEAAYARA